MTTPAYPGVYVEELPSGVRTIVGVATSVPLFIGRAQAGPFDHAVPIASLTDYEATFGTGDGWLGDAVRLFYLNGGGQACILRIGQPRDAPTLDPNDPAFLAALTRACADSGPIAAIDLFTLLVVPGLTDASAILKLQAVAAARRAFLIADCRPDATVATVPAQADAIRGTDAANCALYFPWLNIASPPPAGPKAPDAPTHSPIGKLPAKASPSRLVPPSGAVAGIIARTDAQRGVWKAPAGTDATIRGISGLQTTLTDAQNGQLNPLAINCLRSFPVFGSVAFGARTLAGTDAAGSEWKYVPVRRLALFLEESLYRGTQWAVFEPNGEPLWINIRMNVTAFLQGLFNQGAFAGAKASEAYFVRCDATTTTQADLDLGLVTFLVGFASVKPAEFLTLRIQHKTAQGA